MAEEGQQTEEEMAAAMEAMASGGDDSKALSQDEIDNLLGFSAAPAHEKKTGIEAMLDKALLSYERFPMLEVVFDRFVRMLSTSLRNFTSDNVDVDIHSITSLRFGDYVNSIPMPAILSVFKAIEWENLALVTYNGSIVYSMVDVLFGGRKSNRPIRIEGRPYTSIEQSIVRQVTELILIDMGAAFDPLSPATFQFERIETNPRFATIAHPSDTVVLLQLRVDMEERGGNIEVMFPLVTLEPIKKLLTQTFMGESFGKDSIWELHLGKEIYNTDVVVKAILGKKKTTMEKLMKLKVGDTIILDNKASEDIDLTCEGIRVLKGKIGKVEEDVAIAVSEVINKNMRERD
ncbi:MAG: flagellar motor switch protein FliM [Alphaproteobacteria bacterium CG11_big_fil_rev_8_21_14_0_20_39_49]|nr:MAG: flagellar motor switch protein FliM [Alphaproteobacteria bacterium CG11_big_fil_rev_8_21_14_0_20_39_49]